MLPILPPGGKRTTAKRRPRPRPRAPPSSVPGGKRRRPPAGGSRNTKSAEGDDAPPKAVEEPANEAAAEPAGGAFGPAQTAAPAQEEAPAKTSAHDVRNAPHHEPEEDPLILAAEAAAALMDDLPHGTAGDVADVSLPAGFLDAVGAAADAAADVMVERGEVVEEGGQEGGGGKLDGDLDSEDIKQHSEKGNLPLKAPPTAPSSNLGNNPLGANVRTFESKVPHRQDMSAAQRHFLSYYYGQEAAAGNSLAIRTPRKKVDDEEEEEEEIVEEEGGDGEGDEGEEGTAETGEPKGNKETVKADEDGEKTALPDWRGGTLRDSIATLKRARYEPKKKDDADLWAKAEDDDAEANHVADPTAGGHATVGPKGDADEGHADAPTAAAPHEQPAAGPRVELDASGRISVAPSSLLPNPAARPTAAAIDRELGGTVVEDETPARLGAVGARYDSYAKPRQKPARWDAEETRSWYRALRQCGTDFGMMAAFLPGRTRAQLKRKYKAESRKCPRLVDMALDPRSRVRLDLSVFGDKLEIPDEVPTFPRVTPADSPAPGAAAATAAAAVPEQGAPAVDNGGGKPTGIGDGGKSMERNFDYLFEQDDGGAAADEEKEEPAEEECEPPPRKGAVPEPALAADSGEKSPAEEPIADGEAAKASSDAVVPLAPAVPKARGAKRARFKAKPKGAKKARKK